MSPHPIQITLIDSSHSPGGAAELGLLSTDFPDGPPQRLTIYDVSWVRSDRDPGEALSPPANDPALGRRVGYRSTSPITSGFLRYLDHVRYDSHAARRLAIQPIN